MEDQGGGALLHVMLTPGDEVPPQLTNGQLVLQEHLSVNPDSEVTDGGHQTLTRIIEQKTTSGRASVHNTIIELHTPTENPPAIVVNSPESQASEDTHLQMDAESQLDNVCKVEIRNIKNKTAARPNTLTGSPSATTLCAKQTDDLPSRPKSLGYLRHTGLTENEKLQALRNLQRKSKQPEVFIFPGGMPDLIPDSEIEKESSINQDRWSGHVNTGFRGDKFDSNGYHDNRYTIDYRDNNNVCVTVNPIDETMLHAEHQNHLKYASNGELVHIDYASLFGTKDGKKETSEKEGTAKAKPRERQMSISERALRTVVRQVSRRRCRYRVQRPQDNANADPPPKNYFDLALFSCCCCVSPLGLIALILSVKMDVAYRDGRNRTAQKLSHASLILSLLGIGVTLAVAVIVLVTQFYYNNDAYRDRHLAGGGP